METMNTKTLISIFAAIVIGSSPLYADTNLYQTDSGVLKRLDELAKQVVDLQKLVQNQNEVIKSQAVEMQVFKEKRGEKPTVYIPGAPEKKLIEAPSWLDGMKQGGDFRLRYEAFDNQGGTDQDRNRFRVRLRYGIEKTLGQDFTVGFRLVTGSTSDPTSPNQTLGERFVYKAVVFDKLFVKYLPSQLKGYGPFAQVELGGGKVENPFLLRGASPMVWDSDLTPEGIYETFDFKAIELANLKLAPFVVGAQFPVVENASAGSTDAEMFGVLGGLNSEIKIAGLEKPIVVTNAIGYYDFMGYAENGNFGTLARGNSVDPASATTLEAKDFNILNIYNQVKIPTPWVPIAPFFDFAVNLGDEVGSLKPGNLNDLWGWGIKLGDAKKKGEWETSYGYYITEPNAVVGAFAESDLGGPGFIGHADRRGSIVRLGYKLTDYLSFNLSGYFANTVTKSPNEETRRFQTDLGWKF